MEKTERISNKHDVNFQKLQADFDAVKLALASPEEIKNWSYGEVTKPETINYRTHKPEKDGLFDERIFGPTKDWECYCGKYKRIRYKGVVCDKCGVEVTRSIVRRERMAHIQLAVPVTHIWFLRGTPSSIGLMLNMSIRDLERVVYFANYIVTSVDEDEKKKAVEFANNEYKQQKDEIETTFAKKINEDKENAKSHRADMAARLEDLEAAHVATVADLNSLAVAQLLNETKYRELLGRFGKAFEAGIGAEAVKQLLEQIDLKKLVEELKKEVDTGVGQKVKKALKRLKLVEGFVEANLRPEWMIVTNLPVIPPDLRPMVQLDGGRFAASDLNDLYRRVINRNNRLKRLIELDAPEVICRNEKRMLQEAVDALIDNNARREKAVSSTGGRRRLKSLSDFLKGKQGRFRQNLLGKRVDYSGRSVIVVGPDLKLEQCGLPKMMALELFKPFVISRLIEDGYAHNVKSASRMIERARTEVWDMLEEVITDKHVLLNRAPTLHRLGIQAFKPVLIEGKAIQIHPLVCKAFNADFDGDQMAVHVPLSEMAQKEAREIMLSSKNILAPSDGGPIIHPSLEMVLGCYYLTKDKNKVKGEGKAYLNADEAIYSYDMGYIDLQAKIKVKTNGKLMETTIGRILFNEILPEGMPYHNEVLNSSSLKNVIAEVFDVYGHEATTQLVDDIKALGFKHSTLSGVSLGFDDIIIPDIKKKIIEEAEKKVAVVSKQYAQGLITDEERKQHTISIWREANNEVKEAMSQNLSVDESTIAMMIESGARANVDNINQMAGMKGLVQGATGGIIELPIKSNYKEGFSVLEYFISTHGARKGLTDTALRTSQSGYLTRRLVNVADEVIVTSDDCKTKDSTVISRTPDGKQDDEFELRISSRVAASNIIHPKNKDVIVKAKQPIAQKDVKRILDADVTEVKIRSVFNCESHWGVCAACYGVDLARGNVVEKGTAVGVIAAQSIGEPGTQLTMRTFHSGGIAGFDITQGLPRVEELFEARSPQGQAVISEVDGVVTIRESGGKKTIYVEEAGLKKDEYETKGYKVLVKNGQSVKDNEVLADEKDGKKKIKAKHAGKLRVEGNKLVVVRDGGQEASYLIQPNVGVLVHSGDLVAVGTQLTEGSLNLHDLYRLQGAEAVQRYIVSEIQKIYATQGTVIADKHIEVIVRQMFSRIMITEPGDTQFISGDVVSRVSYLEENERVKNEKGKPAKAESLLLSISKVASSSDSFLAAASFQETARVLINAATRGKIDRLRGLKENVIIGKLIPAGTGFKERVKPTKVKKEKKKEKASA